MAILRDEADGVVHNVQAQITSHHNAILYIILAVVGVFGVSSYLSNKSFEKHLSEADAKYALLQAKERSDNALLNQHVIDREQSAKDIALQAQLTHDRDVQTATLQAKLMLPNTTSAQAEQDYTKYTGYTAKHTVDGEAISQQALQKMTATQVDDVALKADNAAITKSLEAQTKMTASTQDDLTSCEVDKAQSDKVLQDYRKLAKKSRWRHILAGAEKVGLFAAGAVVVYEIKR